MALFNKLFSNNRKGIHKHQDNVSEKLFAFNKDQVRVVLFRECDFRGRKLLFDSKTLKRVPLDDSKPANGFQNADEKFAEFSDGFGYVYTKRESDCNDLEEMVFGSVAMSFRGTYFKMHSLDSPNRLMFSQVFSSPRLSRTCLSSRSDPHGSEHSKFDDSGTSSTSISEHLSVHSTVSDTVLVCRRPYSSPLDVPVNTSASMSIPSLIGDSGYGAGHSFVSPGCTWDSIFAAQGTSNPCLSSSNLFNRWLRRTSTSLENSGHSLATSSSTQDNRHCHRNSKLGLALILQITEGQELELSQFLMEHVSLIEALLWRCKQAVEMAYMKPHNFSSSMFEMVNLSAEHLVNLLSGSYFSVNLWLCLSGCDNNNSISAFSESETSSLNSSLCAEDNGDFYFSFAKFLRTDPFNIKRNFFGENKVINAEKFVQDFCELLEHVDIKNTNFFMSTLLTAVLTYHLGWVHTCLPSTNETKPFNPLWGELSDLYGAVGHPTKLAQTIITGTNRKELVSKILLTMTYFIRCCDVERRTPMRADIEEENKVVEKICNKNACIPKENYKKYEDHLKEILHEREKPKEVKSSRIRKKSSGLAKTQTCMGNLSEIAKNDEENSVSLYSKYDYWGENENTECESKDKNNVVFVLGDNEKLIGLKKENQNFVKRPSFLDLTNKYTNNHKVSFQDCDFRENANKAIIKPSTSFTSLNEKEQSVEKPVKKYLRAQSEPPENHKPEESKHKSKFKYSGVKFSLQQYPQILSNYMKSKNVEISNLRFGDKNLKFEELSTLSETIISKYPEVDEDYDDGEALQTPSNASELEFTSDLFVAPTNGNSELYKQHVPNTTTECDDVKTDRQNCSKHKMNITNLPMPKSKFSKPEIEPVKYTSSLIRAASDSYIPDMVLQGPMLPKQQWESKLKSDLALASQHSLIDQPVEEAVAVIANTDTWEVQLMSSHTFLIDKGSSGIRIGMSQLVSNMLESLLQMWKLKVDPHFCLMHIEQTLQELCIRSKALSDLLLATEFCNMEQLTSTLHLEVNDVPLLLAVASTHSPQVTQKYGLSFQ